MLRHAHPAGRGPRFVALRARLRENRTHCRVELIALAADPRGHPEHQRRGHGSKAATAPRPPRRGPGQEAAAVAVVAAAVARLSASPAPLRRRRRLRRDQLHVGLQYALLLIGSHDQIVMLAAGGWRESCAAVVDDRDRAGLRQLEVACRPGSRRKAPPPARATARRTASA